jgi:hypothetical protein
MNGGFSFFCIEKILMRDKEVGALQVAALYRPCALWFSRSDFGCGGGSASIL